MCWPRHTEARQHKFGQDEASWRSTLNSRAHCARKQALVVVWNATGGSAVPWSRRTYDPSGHRVRKLTGLFQPGKGCPTGCFVSTRNADLRKASADFNSACRAIVQGKPNRMFNAPRERPPCPTLLSVSHARYIGRSENLAAGRGQLRQCHRRFRFRRLFGRLGMQR